MALQFLASFQCFVLLFLMYFASAEIPITDSQVISKPNCSNHCGNVPIPYPFGIGPGCFLDKYFEIRCEENSTKPVHPPGYNISNISILDGEMTTEVYVARYCPNMEFPGWSAGKFGKFTYSTTKNRFIGMGCNTWAYMSQDDNYASTGTGCVSACNKIEDSSDGSCDGVGCCQASVRDGLHSLNLRVGRMFNSKSSSTRSFHYSSSYLKDFKNESVPVVVDWTVGNETCDDAQKNSTSYVCGPNTDCVVPYGNKTLGYRCHCRWGYTGNPYLSTAGGCQDINECNDVCNGDRGNCTNTEGSYTCSCNKGYKLDVRDNRTDCFLVENRSTKNNNLNKIVA
ncbi:hypothetical protein MKW92_045125, partial [Papaver armeniacum]